MRFLIVGCFKQKPKEQLAYWLSVVKSTVESCPQVSDLSNDYIGVRDDADLDQFLLPTHGTGNVDSRCFDLLDVVIIAADSSRLPWSEGNRRVAESNQIFQLVRACVEVNKPLFASGSAALTLVFLCAANLDSPVRILNEGRPPAPVEQSFHMRPSSLQDMLLCAKTGDLHVFAPGRDAWEPRFNAG